MSRHASLLTTGRQQHALLRRRLLIGIAASSALALSACGSSKTTASVATTATTTAAAATAAPTAAAAVTAAPTTAAAATAAPTAAGSTAAGSTAAGSTAAGGTKAAAGTSVAVTETEFKIDGLSATMTAGTYTFNIKNDGKFPHNLVVNGGDIANQKSDTFTAGLSGSLTVTLKPGTYDFFCGVPTHKAKGMDMTVTVT